VFAPLVAAALLAQSLTITAGAEPRIDRYRYRFDNPSSLNTGELVPHFFEQRYEADQVWLRLGARYRINGRPAMTEVGVTPRTHTRGSDIDTFFQPSGDVVTSGTDGPITLRSLSVTQRAGLGRRAGWDFGVSFTYRRDRADFMPDDRVVTHTQPESVTRTFITDRETTVSQVFSFGADASRTRELGGQTRLTVSASFHPLASARLLIQLPDKYPGRDLNYAAVASIASARVELERRISRWVLGVALDAGGGWKYRQTASYSSRGAGLAVFLGRF
jgi:hypothetical protein